MKSETTPKNERKRKALLFLPLLIIPFLTLAFWALGGGQGEGKQKDVAQDGLNRELPDAQLKEEQGQNKLSFYEMAERDSLEFRKGLKQDPFYRDPLLGEDSLGFSIRDDAHRYTYDPAPPGTYQDPNEEKVYWKLAEINRQLNNTGTRRTGNDARSHAAQRKESDALDGEEVDRLERMMQQMSRGGESDPEIEQLSGMMDKILDIQHPERVKKRFTEKEPAPKAEELTVKKMPGAGWASLLGTEVASNEELSGFFGIEQEPEKHNAIEAVVHETQTLVNGGMVKLRLLEDISIQGHPIPKGTFLYGTATLNKERLNIQVTSLRHHHSVFPVKLEVYDLDGLPGIYIPGSLTGEVAKRSADQSLQLLEVSSLDPSLKAQAASAGINAAKALLSKKAKAVKVTIKASYKVLLKEKVQ